MRIFVLVASFLAFSTAIAAQEGGDQVPPVVDLAKYHSIAVFCVGPVPGDRVADEVEANLVKFGASHGIAVVRQQDFAKIPAQLEERLQALRNEAGFGDDVARRKKEIVSAIEKDAADAQATLPAGLMDRIAERSAATAAGEGIVNRYRDEVLRVLAEASEKMAETGFPALDGVLLVRLAAYGPPGFTVIDVGGIPTKDGETLSVTIDAKTWTVAAQGEEKPEVSTTARMGGGYGEEGSDMSFDLGHLDDDLWTEIGTNAAGSRGASSIALA